MATMTPQKFSQLRQKAGDRRRLTPEQLRQALGDLGLKPGMLATLLSTRPERVRSWIEGDEDIPVYLDFVLALLSMPGGPAMARDVLARAEAVPSDQREVFEAWAGRSKDPAMESLEWKLVDLPICRTIIKGRRSFTIELSRDRDPDFDVGDVHAIKVEGDGASGRQGVSRMEVVEKSASARGTRYVLEEVAPPADFTLSPDDAG